MVILNHANNNRKVLINPANIVAAFYNETTKCTVVACEKEMNFPIKESVEEINTLINQSTKGVNNGS